MCYYMQSSRGGHPSLTYNRYSALTTPPAVQRLTYLLSEVFYHTYFVETKVTKANIIIHPGY